MSCLAVLRLFSTKICQRRMDEMNGSGPQGRLAQLEEHLVYTEGVGSSNLSPPTITSPRNRQEFDPASEILRAA